MLKAHQQLRTKRGNGPRDNPLTALTPRPRIWPSLAHTAWLLIAAVSVGRGIIVALCRFLELRPVLSKPGWWLPVAAGAWWLGLGLTAGPEDYNLVVVGQFLGTATGLALRLFLAPTDRPASNRLWSKLSRLLRVLQVIGLVAGPALFLVVFAGLSGLTGLFQP